MRRSGKDKGSAAPQNIGRVAPKSVIRALATYKAKRAAELSFERGDFFHVVVEHPLHSEWVHAVNPLTGAQGLVPASHVEFLGKRVGEQAHVPVRTGSSSNWNGTANTSVEPASGSSTGSHDIPFISPSETGMYFRSQMPLSEELAQAQLRRSTEEPSTAPTSATTFASDASKEKSSESRANGASTPRTDPLYAVLQYDFEAERKDELSAKRGEPVLVIAHSNMEWFVAKPLGRLGGPGLVPVAYVELQDLASGKPMPDPERLISERIPTLEEWKAMIVEHTRKNIPLGAVAPHDVQARNGRYSPDTKQSAVAQPAVAKSAVSQSAVAKSTVSEAPVAQPTDLSTQSLESLDKTGSPSQQSTLLGKSPPVPAKSPTLLPRGLGPYGDPYGEKSPTLSPQARSISNKPSSSTLGSTLDKDDPAYIEREKLRLEREQLERERAELLKWKQEQEAMRAELEALSQRRREETSDAVDAVPAAPEKDPRIVSQLSALKVGDKAMSPKSAASSLSASHLYNNYSSPVEPGTARVTGRFTSNGSQPEAAPSAAAAVPERISPNSSLNRKRQGFLTAAYVESYHVDEDAAWFHVRAQFSSGSTYRLYRTYEDFSDMYSMLANAFPVEAGYRIDAGNENANTIPEIPPLLKNVERAPLYPEAPNCRDACVALGRELSAYLVHLCKIPLYIKKSPAMHEMWATRPGDTDISNGSGHMRKVSDTQPALFPARLKTQRSRDNIQAAAAAAPGAAPKENVRRMASRDNLRSASASASRPPLPTPPKSYGSGLGQSPAQKASQSSSPAQGNSTEGSAISRTAAVIAAARSRSRTASGNSEISDSTDGMSSVHSQDRVFSPPRRHVLSASRNMTSQDLHAPASGSPVGLARQSQDAVPGASGIASAAMDSGDKIDSPTQVASFLHSNRTPNIGSYSPVEESTPDYVKLKVFHQKSDDLIAVKINAHIGLNDLMHKVSKSFGVPVTRLRYKDEVSQALSILVSSQELFAWINSSKRHLLYAE